MGATRGPSSVTQASIKGSHNAAIGDAIRASGLAPTGGTAVGAGTRAVDSAARGATAAGRATRATGRTTAKKPLMEAMKGKKGLAIGAGAAVIAGLAYSGRRGEGSSGGRTGMTRY